MRLTLYTDYSLRVLMYLAADPDQTSTIQEIADSFRISKNHLMKVAYQLGQAGYVGTVRGRNGGLRLARPAAEVRLGDLVRECEGDFTLVECFDAEHNQCVLTPVCKLKHVLREALDAYFQSLNQYTLADLVQQKKALVKILSLKSQSAASTVAALKAKS
ncbi:MAG: Rrf2 family transcriptional regulator [Acidobacteriota bacterium]|nr:Rrf2 family transcriptional regulator [Acidobacteriota bacterium]